MTAVLLTLLLAISSVLSSSSSSAKPKALSFNFGQRRTCTTSPNTQTLLLRDLRHLPVPVEYIRTSPDVLYSLRYASAAKPAAPANGSNNSSGSSSASAGSPLAPTITDPYELALRELFSVAWDRVDYLVEEFLVDLYADYPGVEHINVVFYDPVCCSSVSLLHVAVKTCNKALVSILKRDYGLVIEYNLRDSDGISPAELADLEGSTDVFKHLLRTFPAIVNEPFMGQLSLVHHAAYLDRTDIIEFIDEVSSTHDYKKLCYSSLAILTPLELALREQSLEVAAILIKKEAPIRSEILRIIYAKFMENIHVDNRPILFLLAHFPATLLYFKNKNGADVMELAVGQGNGRLVCALFEIGYTGNLETLLNLTRSVGMQELIISQMQ